MRVDMLGEVMSVADRQASTEGVAANEPTLDTKLCTDLFELLKISLWCIKRGIRWCRRTAVPPKLYCHWAAYAAKGLKVCQPLGVRG